jgi:hypothetical protein
MVERIVYEPKGSFLLNPTLGVNAQALLNGPFRPGAIKKKVSIQLGVDNFTVFAIEVGGEGNDRTLRINARRQ